MTRRELMDELKAAGVTFNTKAAKAELEKLYAEVQAQTQEKEENNMKNQNTQEVATTKAADYDAHIDLVIDTIDQAHNVEADVYPNLGDWIKIKLAGKTVLEARFGKNELRVQAAEEVAKEAHATYKLVTSFSKPATIFLPYDEEGMNQLGALIGAAGVIAARKQEEKAAAKAAKEAAKAAERAAKKAAKAAAKEEAKEAADAVK